MITTGQQPEMVTTIERIANESLPYYSQVAHLPYAFRTDAVEWPEIYKLWPDHQFVLCDTDTGDIVACGNSLPLDWRLPITELPDSGWDWAVDRGLTEFSNGIRPNTLVALLISTPPSLRNKGHGAAAIMAMRQLAAEKGYIRLIAPVRPSLKHLYPLVTIGEYLSWKNNFSMPFDPWVRTHVRLGGEIIGPCSKSMTFKGRVSEWEQWIGLKLPSSHSYVVPEMLSTLEVRVEQDEGVYIEPNVWVHHKPICATLEQGSI